MVQDLLNLMCIICRQRQPSSVVPIGHPVTLKEGMIQLSDLYSYFHVRTGHSPQLEFKARVNVLELP